MSSRDAELWEEWGIPNGSERVEALGCRPRKTLLLDLVLNVSRSHVDGERCRS